MSGPAAWAVVTPVFEDRESFEALCRELAALRCPVRLEVVAVDDGSVGRRPEIEALSGAGLAGRIVRLRRNVGHQMAISVGLDRVSREPRFEGVVVLDSDGEDRPEHVPLLIAAVADGRGEVAVATRRRRAESLGFRVFYRVYRLFFRLLTGRLINFGNFMAMRRAALMRLAAMQETRVHLAAAVMKSRLPRAELALDRGRRYAGRSRMSFTSLALHGIRAVTVFDDAVLTRMALTCAVSALLAVVVFAAATGLKLIGMASPGWLTTVTGFMVMVFLQTGLLTLVTLIMSGLTFRSPAVLGADADSLILDIEATNAPVVL